MQTVFEVHVVQKVLQLKHLLVIVSAIKPLPQVTTQVVPYKNFPLMQEVHTSFVLQVLQTSLHFSQVFVESWGKY